jgi:hypothetical protein
VGGPSFFASKTTIFDGWISCSTESIVAATSGDQPLAIIRKIVHQADTVLSLNTGRNSTHLRKTGNLLCRPGEKANMDLLSSVPTK